MRKGIMQAVVRTVVGTAGGVVVGWAMTFRKCKKEIGWRDARIDKFKKYFDLTNEWIRLKNQGRNLEEFFKENGWSNIAIYGMGELGNRLAEELKDSSVSVKYAIDKKADISHPEIEVLEISEELPCVDVIVVTPFFMYEAVEAELMDLVEYPIISIEDVVLFI